MTIHVRPRRAKCERAAWFRLIGVAVVFGSAAAVLTAQTTSAPGARQQGLYLFGGTAAFGYSTLGPAQLAGSMRAVGLEPDYFASSSFSAGYASTGPSGALSLTYTPTYINQFRYSTASGFGQTLSLGIFRRAGAKTSFSFGVAASDSRTAQYAFTSGSLSRLAAAPGTSEALGAAATGRSFADVPIASVLSTPATTDAAAQAALYGARVLAVTASASSSYMHSPRTTFFVSASGARTQPLQANDEARPAGTLTLQSISAEAQAGVSYDFNARSNIGVSAGHRRSRSQYAESAVTNASLTLGRQLSRRWFGSATGGAARVDLAGARIPSLATQAAPRYTYTGGATLGVRARSQTLLGRYSRGAGDTYGVGSGSSQGVELAWSISRPGRSWSASFSGAREEMTRGIQDIQMWRVEASVSRTVNAHLALVFANSWIESSTRGATLFPMASGYYARVTFVFSTRSRIGAPQ